MELRSLSKPRSGRLAGGWLSHLGPPTAPRSTLSLPRQVAREDSGIITNLTKGETYQAEPFPPFIKEMIAKGGLMASLAAKEN